MKDETKAKLAEAFKTAVRAQVAKGNHARWGESESVNAILEVIAAWADDEDAVLEGTDAIQPYIARCVNPSAFAQSLEKLPADHPSKINRPERGKGGAKAAISV